MTLLRQSFDQGAALKYIYFMSGPPYQMALILKGFLFFYSIVVVVHERLVGEKTESKW